MKGPELRFTITLVLFVAWIGWLTYLVMALKSSLPPGATRPVVLSRPQFLVSSLDIIAEVPAIDPEPAEVVVQEVAWPKDPAAQALVGQKLRIRNLAECRDDWHGSGLYILPLFSAGADSYQVVPLPRSPGFPSGRPRIYPATPQTRQQLQAIDKSAALVDDSRLK